MSQHRIQVAPVVYDGAVAAKIRLMLHELSDSEILCMYPYYMQPGREAGLALLEDEMNRRTPTAA